MSSKFNNIIKESRCISATSTSYIQARTEFASHEDSHRWWANDLILYMIEDKVNVTPFSDYFDTISEVPVLYTAVAKDYPIICNNQIVVINDVLRILDIEVNLIPPFMARLNCIIVNEYPKLLTPSSTIEYHLIFFLKSKIRLSLDLYGITSYIPTRQLTLSKEVYSDTSQHLTVNAFNIIC